VGWWLPIILAAIGTVVWIILTIIMFFWEGC